MFRVVFVAALASIVSGCVTSDQNQLYSQSAKLRPTQAARTTAAIARPAKIAEPQIVLGATY